jgi:hypothetical protein
VGIDAAGAHFLAMAAAAGVDLSTTLTLGRQSRFGTPATLVAALAPFDLVDDAPRLEADLGAAGDDASPLLRALGAGTVEALDADDFEGASVLHDLNIPVPDALAGRWSCVVDGGTLEHVFHLPVALASAMAMVAPGGHLISIAPANQQVGHGFYQLGPELFHAALCPENGFEVRCVLLHEAGLVDRWSRCPDPAAAGHRIEVQTLGPATLYVLARRTGDASLDRVPQQSDYARAWEDKAAPVVSAPRRRGRGISRLLTPGMRLRAVHGKRIATSLLGRQLPRVDLPTIRDELLAAG